MSTSILQPHCEHISKFAILTTITMTTRNHLRVPLAPLSITFAPFPLPLLTADPPTLTPRPSTGAGPGFRKFKKLPPELRIMIWKFTAPHARMIFIDSPCCFQSKEVTVQEGETCKSPFPSSSCTVYQVPRLQEALQRLIGSHSGNEDGVLHVFRCQPPPLSRP
jgi:hypothetical protein